MGSPEATSALSAALAPGMGMTATPAAMASAVEPASGIADARHSGVGDHGDAPAGLERLDQLGGTLVLVVLVAAHGGGGDLEVVEQLLRLAGVLAGDAVHAAEHVQGVVKGYYKKDESF